MEITLIFTAVIVILLGYLLKKYVIDVNAYWRKKGIPTVPGSLPFVGHIFSIFWFEGSLTAFYTKAYETYKDRSMVGLFQFREPNLMLLEQELVKTVMVSSFAKFHENAFNIDFGVDPLLAQNPFFNAGERWKVLRNRLSYALMSGKRLRILCHSVAQVCKKFTKHLRDSVKESKNGVYEFEGKELGNCFTGEVVASAGFGVEGDFFVKGSGPDSFYQAITGFFAPTLLNTIVQVISIVIPKINSILRISILPKKTDRFFRRVVHNMIEIRLKDGIPRNDFLQLMLENQRNEGIELDEEAITASATSFFVDGYETSAITLEFFIYAISTHPEVQEKLRDEVRRALDNHDGEITYESLKEMTYMDQALYESMRCYPAFGFLTKKCTARCELVGSDGLRCTVEPGTVITIPTEGMQKDPGYWENPEIYDPERFNEESKKDGPKRPFLPFGEGPRICVGMRFALMQIKGAVASILKDFAVEVSPKTEQPLRFKKSALLTAVEGGLWFNLKSL